MIYKRYVWFVKRHYSGGIIMATTYTSNQSRIAGWVLLAGTITMAVGAVIGSIYETFFDDGLESGEFGEFLTNAVTNSGAAKATIWLSIFGVLGIGLGGVLLSRLGDRNSLATKTARFSFTVGAGAGIVLFPVLLGVIEELAPRYVAGEDVETTARAIAYIGTTADWIATVVILGLGVATLAYAGRNTWVPRWLYRWSLLAAAAGVVSMIGTITNARSTVSMIILPVAMTWLIAAGIVAIRSQGDAVEEGAPRESADHSAAG
ncbi:MAG: hypothetical protein ACC654_03150 [Acidimicrobiia bacterium]